MDYPVVANSDIVTNLLKREAERKIDLQKKRNEKQQNPEHEQYSYFMRGFQNKIKEIELLLKTVSNEHSNDVAVQFDKIAEEIYLLQKFVGESVLFLRGYDIRICQDSLQEIETKAKKLEDKLLPKKKFGFKMRDVLKIVEEKEPIPANSQDQVDSISEIFKFSEDFFGFKDESHKALQLPNDCLYKKEVTLHNLEKCIVKLLGAPSTLNMSSLNNCVIICGPISTSVFAENCNNCKIVIACQQLRLHSSTGCEIYLHVTSKAIIEDCNNVKVAPYNYVYDSLCEDFAHAGLDLKINHWNEIDDFNWLVVDKHSPNWSILEESDRIFNWEEYILTL